MPKAPLVVRYLFNPKVTVERADAAVHAAVTHELRTGHLTARTAERIRENTCRELKRAARG